jgi:hypothetical protein
MTSHAVARRLLLEGWSRVKLTILDSADGGGDGQSYLLTPSELSFDVWPSCYARPVIHREPRPAGADALPPSRSRTAGYTVRMPAPVPIVVEPIAPTLATDQLPPQDGKV